MEKQSITAQKSFHFAVEIIELCKSLRRKKEFVLADQLLRSGTSIGANIEEARGAQSKKDFISKLSIAMKEARETRYWVLLLKETNVLEMDFSLYLNQLDEIIRLIVASIKTAKGSDRE
ncbi:MAG TPA: four helix bundle protein [Balneolales bacterium]|nr:four helix bundle protein [Balneolales bacterium]